VAILQGARLWKQYRLGESPVNAPAGVNLTVECGDLSAILRPPGSGKPTLLHLLGGRDRPSGGQITLAGLRLAVLNVDALPPLRAAWCFSGTTRSTTTSRLTPDTTWVSACTW